MLPKAQTWQEQMTSENIVFFYLQPASMKKNLDVQFHGIACSPDAKKKLNFQEKSGARRLLDPKRHGTRHSRTRVL
jgi:hypothetical protein